MGLPRRLRIDARDLERRFYDLSRTLHPDCYQNAESYEQRVSLESSAVLNRAYRALREPFARAEYLLKLESGSDKELVPSPPNEFLEQVFEFNERLQDFQTEEDEGRKKALGAAADAGDDPAETLENLRTLLSQRKYIQNAVRDITEALHCHTSV
jgi:molecular chaperone HscB